MSIPAGLYPGAASIAALLGGHGYRKGSLSISGAIAAFLVGYGHLANPLKLFGSTMIAFYLIGSRATKVKADVKASLEDGPDPSKPGGNRDWIQVLSNSLPSLIAALLYRFSDETSTIDPTTKNLLSSGLSRTLIFMTLGHFSTSLADTLASELGILSTKPPIYLLTLKPCPPGTNGGISFLGLIASAIGGLIIGGFMAFDLFLENGRAIQDYKWWIELIAFGTISGLTGSLLDSLLGATLQQTLYSTKTLKILTDHSDRTIRADDRLKKIGFGIDVLSNSAVNLICGCVMGLVGAWWGSRT